MPVVRLVGHQDAFVLNDVLRLYFGPPSLADPQTLTVGQDDWQLESAVEPLTPAAAAGSAGSDEADVQVSTRLWLGPPAGVGPPAQAVSRRCPPGGIRRELKRQLYCVLEQQTGIAFPWGSLTGVRPTQIAWEVRQRTGSLALARNQLVAEWRLQPAKADLALVTAQAEADVLARIPAGSALVYVGIPFCPSRCAYCSFIAQDAQHRAGLLDPYVDAVIAEARQVFSRLELPLAALYLGGGTPTSLSDTQFARLLAGLRRYVPLLPGAEITVEAGRPDTITSEKLRLIRNFGATRLCINPQTLHDRTLQRIGRRHTTAQTLAAMQLARAAGFGHINMDLIAGLPGETAADFSDSLAGLLDLAPESITVHTLAIKRSSQLSQAVRTAADSGPQIHRPDADLAVEVSQARQTLAAAGYEPYYLYRQKDVAGGLENVGYARLGQACLYNVGMMSDQVSVIGLGSGAMTKHVAGRKVTRAPNAKDIANYISRLDELVERKLALFATAALPAPNRPDEPPAPSRPPESAVSHAEG